METLKHAHFTQRSGYLNNRDQPLVEKFQTSYAESGLRYTNKMFPTELEMRSETQFYSVENNREHMSTIQQSSFREKPPRTAAEFSRTNRLDHLEPRQAAGYDKNNAKTMPFKKEYLSWQSRIAEAQPQPVGRPDSYQNTFRK